MDICLGCSTAAPTARVVEVDNLRDTMCRACRDGLADELADLAAAEDGTERPSSG